MAPNIQLIFRRMIKGYYLIITVFPLILTAARGEEWMTWRYSIVWSETCFMRANCCLISEKLLHHLITLKPINLLYISRAIFVFITVALLTCERLCNCFRVNQRRELRTRSALFPLQVVLIHELVFSSQFRSDKMEQHHIDFFFLFRIFWCLVVIFWLWAFWLYRGNKSNRFTDLTSCLDFICEVFSGMFFILIALFYCRQSITPS